MPLMTPQICAALDAAGIPYTGIDPITGTVNYAPSATQAQITQGTAIVATWNPPSATTLQQAQRSPANGWLSAVELTGLAALERARDQVIADEFNNVIAWINNFTAAVAAATSLSDLKTRVAALSVPATLTKQNVLAAITNALGAGSGDTTTS